LPCRRQPSDTAAVQRRYRPSPHPSRCCRHRGDSPQDNCSSSRLSCRTQRRRMRGTPRHKRSEARILTADWY
jgi:hypothetical protein